MENSLLVAVHLHDGRYHGEDDGFKGASWPPSPARLFQGLLAGVARGSAISLDDQRALHWLEELPPPRIAAPASRLGGALPVFVPNNDLDAVGGDPANVGKIRVGKTWRPRYFDASTPILYVWEFAPPDTQAHRVCSIATRLYQLGRGVDMAAATSSTAVDAVARASHQLGRGVDMAAATGKVMSQEEVDAALAGYSGPVWRPGGTGIVGVPAPGSLTSLLLREQGRRRRLVRDASGETLFTQPPKARFRHVGYEAPPRRLRYELRDESRFAPHPLHSAATLVTGVRDQAARRLQDALPARSEEIERLVIGRNADPQDLVLRPRIMPIPSIGTEHTDPSIRRLTVEIPQECPISSRDLEWAFAGLEPMDAATGEAWSGQLVSTTDSTMADRFERPSRLFRSVTAVALSRAHRRPAGDAQRRREDEARASAAVLQALRHSGVRAKPSSIVVQREPLHRHGATAEAFAHGSRFSPMAMWHVEIRFPTELRGPLVIGDGRFCGLGLMVPVAMDHCDVFALELEEGVRVAGGDARALLRSVRRALMALARDSAGRVGRLFSGHEADGRPDQSRHHAHIYLAADSGTDGSHEWVRRIVVAAPWAVDREAKSDRREQRLFDRVVCSLVDLRAGVLGRFRLSAAPIGEGDPTIGPARTWKGVTEYTATRNMKKRDDPRITVEGDVRAECARQGILSPRDVEVSKVSVGPRGGGLKAAVTLHFNTAVRGPILLGRDSHTGGGLFHAVPLDEGREKD